MNIILRDRIQARLDALGLSASAASQKIGGKETLRKIMDGTTRFPRTDTLAKLADVLQTSEDYLLGRTNKVAPRAPSAPDDAAADRQGREIMIDDVPVMGTAAGSLLRGAFQLQGGAVDTAPRPPGLAGVRQAYALYVEGSSMEPQFWPGNLIYLHPHKPARAGDVVVVQLSPAEHQPEEATLGVYVRQTASHLIIGKHNPKAEVQLPREHVVAIHKVLTTNELFGK